jgi:hypothetical protein
MIYAVLSIMFFQLLFDLVDRRALPSTDAGLAFGQEASLMLGVIKSMTLLGLTFAVLVALLTASVRPSLPRTEWRWPPASRPSRPRSAAPLQPQ